MTAWPKSWWAFVATDIVKRELPFFDMRHDAVLREVADWLATERSVDSLEEGDHCADSRAFVRSLGDARPAATLRGGAAGRTRAPRCPVDLPCPGGAQLSLGAGRCGVHLAGHQRGTDRAGRQRGPAAAMLAFVTLRHAHTGLALSEPGGGSDVAATSTTAQRDGADFVLNGEKTWTLPRGRCRRAALWRSRRDARLHHRTHLSRHQADAHLRGRVGNPEAGRRSPGAEAGGSQHMNGVRLPHGLLRLALRLREGAAARHRGVPRPSRGL